MKDAILAKTELRKSKRLEKMLPEIEEALKAGLTYRDIVAHLSDQGFVINLDTFGTYLCRLRKRAKHNASTKRIVEKTDFLGNERKDVVVQPSKAGKGTPKNWNGILRTRRQNGNFLISKEM